MTIRLYHGTSEDAWHAIREAGAIQPRGQTKRDNWKHNKCSSHPNCVYLTDVYAPYFSLQAAETHDDGTVIFDDNNIIRVAIMEIDVEAIRANLVPDEDALEQANRKGNVTKSKMRRDTARFRSRLHTMRGDDEAWQSSVLFLGTCAHFGPIPISAIKRVALVPVTGHHDHAIWSLNNMQPLITRQNYMLCGDRYRELTAEAFTLPNTEIVTL